MLTILNELGNSKSKHSVPVSSTSFVQRIRLEHQHLYTVNDYLNVSGEKRYRNKGNNFRIKYEMKKLKGSVLTPQKSL